MHFQVTDTTCFFVVSVTTYLAIKKKNVAKIGTIFIVAFILFYATASE